MAFAAFMNVPSDSYPLQWLANPPGSLPHRDKPLRTAEEVAARIASRRMPKLTPAQESMVKLANINTDCVTVIHKLETVLLAYQEANAWRVNWHEKAGGKCGCTDCELYRLATRVLQDTREHFEGVETAKT